MVISVLHAAVLLVLQYCICYLTVGDRGRSWIKRCSVSGTEFIWVSKTICVDTAATGVFVNST